MSKKKRDFEDDGRIIVDMSGVERPNLFSFRSTQTLRRTTPELPSETREDKKEEDYSKYYNKDMNEVSKKETFQAILGSLGAALLVAGIFIVVFAIVIILMLVSWNK
ncbi:MAG: hypothetical protein IKN38_06650 [Clostridia bacterium]|nr:hypothetical protein [Clostridia bacterium]